jgi:hypothetical protein
MSFFQPKAVLLAFCAGISLSSCITYRETVAIHFSSDPPGADVLVNGVASGFATPCMIALKKEKQIVSLRKNGFQSEGRYLFPDPKNDTWYFGEATVGPHTFDFPSLINLDEFLQPVTPMRELIPGRIFIRLKRESDLHEVETADESAGDGE